VSGLKDGLGDTSGEGLSVALEDALTGPGTITVEDTRGRQAEVDVIDLDRLGVEVERVRVKTPAAGDLAGRARALASSLRPSGERLVPVEVDERLGGGVLRTAREDIRGRRFFQVDLDPDGAEFGRYRVDDAGDRHPERFTVTREQLGQIVDALSHEPLNVDES
jgi:hypothetical protein